MLQEQIASMTHEELQELVDRVERERVEWERVTGKKAFDGLGPSDPDQWIGPRLERALAEKTRERSDTSAAR